MKVEVQNLTRCFGELKAVDRASFSFHSGAVYGFIGPNGAGKTTTLRVLATVDVPTSGQVLFDDESIVHYPDRARQRLGFMPDTLDAYPDLTVFEYLDFFARAYRLRGRERTRRLAQIMEFTELGNLTDKLTTALSKGMKQRLSLARTLIHDPDVLLLDEPAAGLDPRARVDLRRLIRILAEQGKAILVSSHILAELSEICDGVVIIEQGRILRTGTVTEVQQGLRPHVQILVELDEPREGLERFLLEQPGVEAVQARANLTEFDFDGDRRARAALLARLVQAGFPVSQFRLEQRDLEDLFLEITKGEVC